MTPRTALHAEYAREVLAVRQTQYDRALGLLEKKAISVEEVEERYLILKKARLDLALAEIEEHECQGS